jgi:hypothetical protein
MIKKACLLVALPLCVACGSKQTQETHEEHASHEEQGKHEEHEHNMPASLHAFHDVLAPLFHAPSGPDRVTSTCAHAAELRDKAAAVEADTDHGATWKEASTALTVATRDLSAACDADGRPHVEDKLGDVHTRFHAVMESAEH